MVLSRARRNVLILVACQALYMSGTSLMVVTSPLAGYLLADDKALATVPITTHHLGVMAATLPASFLMRRFGRRIGFQLGAVIGILGAAFAGWTIMQGTFWAFCAATFTIGCCNGFAVFYRFAAADTAEPEFRPKAISWVMVGGLFAAFLGPELAKASRTLLEPILFAGSFYALIGVYAVKLALISLVDIPPMTAAERKVTGRPLGRILAQPSCMVAVATGFIAYGVMALLMTSTPLAMVACGFGFDSSATVIQLHIIGMFLPSFFTGHLIKRFGTMQIIVTGTVITLACAAIGLAGIGFLNFAGGLFLLGVGWNFMFIGATTLLTETHHPSERAKVQGFNDFLIFGTIAASSFLSGNLLYYFGWTAINLGVLPFLFVSLGLTLWFWRGMAAQARA